jgi:tetratricopeptide (TPR) repeat protein
MDKKLWVVTAMLIVACAVLVIVNVGTGRRLAQSEADLEDYKKRMSGLSTRTREAESGRDSVQKQTRELREALSALQDERQQDSRTIEQLWDSLQRSTRAGAASGREVRYDLEAIKELLTSSDGDLEKLLAQIMTPEAIRATLEQHSDDPTYWVAAASLLQDKDEALKYLEEAAALHPKSAVVLSSLVQELMAKEQFDETTMAHIATLKEVDPANSLPDYYEANCRFQSGDIQGALQCLADASVKDRFADYGMDLLMTRNNYFLNEGCTDSIALGLSAFTLPLSQMGMIRGVGRSSMEQARELIAAGRSEEGLRIANSVLSTGRNLSSSGRFLIYDLVGMSLQKLALNEQRGIYEGMGNTLRTEQIDSQLQALEERLSLIKVMAGSFGDIMRDMSEEDIANYVRSTIRSGEFSTLRDISGVEEALK